MQQFSSAYDVYLEVKKRVRSRVDVALQRSSPNWRIMHACPCCQFELKEDDALEVRMLVAQDGNDSLKRVDGRKEAGDDSKAEAMEARSTNRFDPRQAGGDYFLSREEVDKWEDSNWENIPTFDPEGEARQWSWSTTNCEEKWLNADDSKTGKSWAKFDENGIFLLICRHGFVLSFADMVKSGEKYVVAITSFNYSA